jgi:hypothetical protein
MAAFAALLSRIDRLLPPPPPPDSPRRPDDAAPAGRGLARRVWGGTRKAAAAGVDRVAVVVGSGGMSRVLAAVFLSQVGGGRTSGSGKGRYAVVAMSVMTISVMIRSVMTTSVMTYP